MRVGTIAIAVSAGPSAFVKLRARVLALLPSRAAARLVLRYWRLRAAIRRRTTGLKGPGALATASHGVVLSLGLVLVLPALSGAPRTATAHPAAALDGAVLARPMAMMVGGRNAVQVAELAVERREVPPPPPAPAPASPRPAFVPPPPGAGGAGLAAIYAVFNGSSGLSWALRVAHCESRYNPLALNRSSGASGLFQFMPRTWNANFPGWNIWDPMAQARGALIFYNAGRQSAWTCK